MRLLPKEHPDTYHQFIQTTPEYFRVASRGITLQQTIQRSKTSQSVIIVHTSKGAYITEGELVYDGVLNIYDACTKLTYIESGYSQVELPLHHELSGNIPIQFNETVSYCIY